MAFYRGLFKTSIRLVYATEQFRQPVTSEAKKNNLVAGQLAMRLYS